MKLGTSAISKLMLGSQTVSRVMLGTTEVWSAFSPLSLSPALWLDASDASTLYDATTGGSLVAADGAIARWQDKSGNARHATQATLANRPLLKTAIQNGKSVARFDGSNDFMVHGMTTTSGSFSIFAVTKELGVQSSYRGIVAVGIDSDSGSMLLSKAQSTWGTYSSSSAASPSTSAAGTSAFRLLCMIDNGAAGGFFYMDAAANGTWAGNTRGQTLPHVGGSAGQYTYSDIAEILVFPSALSDTNRQQVERYLGEKWGITVA